MKPEPKLGYRADIEVSAPVFQPEQEQVLFNGLAFSMEYGMLVSQYDWTKDDGELQGKTGGQGR